MWLLARDCLHYSWCRHLSRRCVPRRMTVLLLARWKAWQTVALTSVPGALVLVLLPTMRGMLLLMALVHLPLLILLVFVQCAIRRTLRTHLRHL